MPGRTLQRGGEGSWAQGHWALAHVATHRTPRHAPSRARTLAHTGQLRPQPPRAAHNQRGGVGEPNRCGLPVSGLHARLRGGQQSDGGARRPVQRDWCVRGGAHPRIGDQWCCRAACSELQLCACTQPSACATCTPCAYAAQISHRSVRSRWMRRARRGARHSTARARCCGSMPPARPLHALVSWGSAAAGAATGSGGLQQEGCGEGTAPCLPVV